MDKSVYARKFGLPVEQIRFFDELSEHQQGEVVYLFNNLNANRFVYAVKRSGELVWRRLECREGGL